MRLSQNPVECIRVAHSPDADDRFMFWPLRAGLVSHPNFSFTFSEADTQSLNQWSETIQPDICAISAMHYGRVAHNYQPMRMGCSVGNNYGPIVVVRNSRTEALQSRAFKLLTPGPQTTAHAILLMLGYEFTSQETVPIVPIERVFERLHASEAQGCPTAALLIHEGRLIFQKFQCRKVLDIGEAWKLKTGGSLPLGMNVISRKLSIDMRLQLSKLCIGSCHYAQNHLEEYLKLAAKTDSPYFSPLSALNLRKYLDLYANETTKDVNKEDKLSFETLLKEGSKVGIIPAQAGFQVDWI